TPNRLPMSLAVLERRSAPRATRTRFTPLSANSLAIARPIPALAPVTMAVFPAMPKFMSCSLHQAPVRTKLDCGPFGARLVNPPPTARYAHPEQLFLTVLLPVGSHLHPHDLPDLDLNPPYVR